MSIPALYLGDHGFDFVLQLVDGADDFDGTGYTVAFLFTSPSGEITEEAASAVTDGTDGRYKVALPSELFPEEDGETGGWKVQAKATKSGVQKKSAEVRFNVLQGAVAS
jgi:hypothetical protein